jgi:hypothetical protein
MEDAMKNHRFFWVAVAVLFVLGGAFGESLAQQIRTKAVQAPLKPGELPAPVITQVNPVEVSQLNVTITVRGRNFGGADPSGKRRIVLTQKDGGMKAIPPVDSWSGTEIRFKSPDLSGLYELKVDNASSNPLSNGVEIWLGVKQKEVLVDFGPVFGGTRLDTGESPCFYLGPVGGRTNVNWRTVYGHVQEQFPATLLTFARDIKVVSKAWAQGKNTMYDIFVKCAVFFKCSPPQVYFSGNHVVFIIRYTAEIQQKADTFWYNTQSRTPHPLKDPVLTEPMSGTLTISVPLSVQLIGSKRMILSSKAEISWTGDFAFKNQWPDSNIAAQLKNDWATGKGLLQGAIAEKFGGNEYKMSVFGNEFTNYVLSLLGPGAKLVRFETEGQKIMRVFYLGL